MKRILIAVTIVTSGVCVTTQAIASGDPAKGKELYKVCAACHGDNGEGNKALNSPRNAGLGDWYLIRQLKNFKDGIRGTDPKDVYGAQMRPMAMTLVDDQAIADVVAYISSLEAATPEETVTGDVEKGKAAYAPCAACHGPTGLGNTALNAPRLAGQHDWYIVRQLKDYKSGIRGTHPDDTYGAQMRPMAMTLATDEAINDVAAYINTLE
ncbi:MAG: cytochrome c4 [Gammaproteobacteria bacterium]|nr:cytochrome c4 [Gammaproteobacteria bacterium]